MDDEDYEDVKEDSNNNCNFDNIVCKQSPNVVPWNIGSCLITNILLMYGKVWFHPQGIANILSLARLKEIQGHFGMPLDYPAIGKVQILMSDYIKRILESLPPSMDGESVTQQQITCS